MKLENINKNFVKPVKLKSSWKEDSDIFNWKYSNCYICARKSSGKTNTMFHMLKELLKLKKHVIIVFFCSTINSDPTYKHITKYLTEKRKKDLLCFTSINEENSLNTINEYLQGLDTTDDDDDDEPIEYIFIFDDLSIELRDKRIDYLLKRNKNFKITNIISSQSITDVLPSSRNQFDLILLFGGHCEDKIKKIYENADLNVDFDTFLKMYNEATREKYHFLYIDTRNGEYRKNFNQRFKLEL